MDGVMQQLEALFKNLGEGGGIDLGETVLTAIKETIDEEVAKFKSNISETVRRDTSGLASSLTVTKHDGADYYGYTVEFAGNAPNGEPYEKIANVLNYGTDHAGKSKNVTVPATFFVTRAVGKLRGMDKRIYKKAIKDLDKKGGDKL